MMEFKVCRVAGGQGRMDAIAIDTMNVNTVSGADSSTLHYFKMILQ